MNTGLFIFILLCALAVPITAQPKRIYIAPDDHTDYMWTGDEEAYRRAFVEMIDYYLGLADKTATNAPEHRSRWHCDGAIWYWTYERNKTPAEFARLIERTRDGSISLPLNFLVATYGGTPTEAADSLSRHLHTGIFADVPAKPGSDLTPEGFNRE